jgi:glycerophosphoryl diester phosphodiesterase
MTRDHDLLHTVLAEAHGLPTSPTLHAVARGHQVHPLQADIEERSVLLMQRLLNAGVAGVLPTT